MKLPKHAPESTLIEAANVIKNIYKAVTIKIKHYISMVTNNHSIQKNTKTAHYRIISKRHSRFSTYLSGNISGVH
jgi:hypothetical protein